jgi:hypothetical protein
MPWTFARYANVLTPVLAFGGLFLGVWRGQPSWLDAPALKPRVLGYVDMRYGDSTLFAKEAAPLDVTGWAACDAKGSTLSSVSILVNGEKRAEVRDFLLRPDVAAFFHRPDFALSGWKASVPLLGLKTGEYVLTARGLCSRGGEGALPAVRLSVLE